MPNEIAELQLVIKSDNIEKANKRLKVLGTTGKRTDEQLERLDFTLGAMNRNLLASARRTDRLAKEQAQATRTTNRLLREQIKATRETRKATVANKKLAASTKGITASQVRNLAALGGLTYGLIRYSQALVRAERTNIQITNGLNFVTGSAEGTRKEFDFITRKANQYGQDIRTLAREYSKFAAASKGTALEGAESRLVLEGMSAAASTLALDADQVSGAMKAMEQIMSKGKVQAEELRGQLGERIPGAFQIAARAMNVTTAELNKMLELGQVVSVDFLPRFSRELIKTFGGDIANKTDTLTGAINRLNNEIFLMFTDERNNLANSFKDIIVDMTEVMKDPSFQNAVIEMNSMMGFMLKLSSSGFANVFNAPQRIAQHVDIAQMEGLIRGLESETDPVKRAEISSMLNAVTSRISARSRTMKGVGSPRTGVEGGDIEVGGKPEASAISRREFRDIRKKGFGFLDDPKSRLDKLNAQHQEERAFLKENQNIIFDSKEDFYERLFLLDQSYADKRKGLNKEIAVLEQSGFRRQLTETSKFFSELELLSQGSSKELFAISKAMALSTATIDGFVAIQKAWGSAPFPFNIPAVAMTTASTAVNVAAIESQSFAGNFAEGGIVPGTSYTGDRMVANVNSGEMILNKTQQQRLLSGETGGGPRQLKIVNNLGVEATATATQDSQGNEVVVLERRILNKVRKEAGERSGPMYRNLSRNFKTKV